MPESVSLIPCRRPELLVGPLGDCRVAVSDPRSGQYFQMGEEEAFLLSRLDGRHTQQKIRKAFEIHFSYPISTEELQGFLQLADDQGCLETDAPVDKPHFDEVPFYESQFAESRELYHRAERVIAGATTHDRRDFGPFPIFIRRADGPYKWDVSGRRLLDLWMGHGAWLGGHNFPPRRANHSTANCINARGDGLALCASRTLRLAAAYAAFGRVGYAPAAWLGVSGA